MLSRLKWLIFIFAIAATHNAPISIILFIVVFLIQLSTEDNENNTTENEEEEQNEYNRNYRKVSNTTENADIGLIYLAAYIMQIENLTHKNQLQFIKNFLSRNFDQDHVYHRLNLLNRLLEMNISYEDGCRRIIYYYEIEDRYKIIDFLFSLAAADGRVTYYEMMAIKRISHALYVNATDFEKLKQIYFRESEYERNNREYRERLSYTNTTSSIDIYYQRLGLVASATNEELKNTYRKKVLQYHPDKWLNASAIEQENAKKKFIEIQEAYDKIRYIKGIK